MHVQRFKLVDTQVKTFQLEDGAYYINGYYYLSSLHSRYGQQPLGELTFQSWFMEKNGQGIGNLVLRLFHGPTIFLSSLNVLVEGVLDRSQTRATITGGSDGIYYGTAEFYSLPNGEIGLKLEYTTQNLNSQTQNALYLLNDKEVHAVETNSFFRNSSFKIRDITNNQEIGKQYGQVLQK